MDHINTPLIKNLDTSLITLRYLKGKDRTNYALYLINQGASYAEGVRIVDTLTLDTTTGEHKCNLLSDHRQLWIYYMDKVSIYDFNVAARNGYGGIVRLLILEGKPGGSDIFDIARNIGDVELIELLLLKGYTCDTWFADSCAMFGYTELIKLLIKYNQPFSSRAIRFAANKSYYDIVQLLLDHGD